MGEKARASQGLDRYFSHGHTHRKRADTASSASAKARVPSIMYPELKGREMEKKKSHKRYAAMKMATGSYV